MKTKDQLLVKTTSLIENIHHFCYDYTVVADCHLKLFCSESTQVRNFPQKIIYKIPLANHKVSKAGLSFT